MPVIKKYNLIYCSGMRTCWKSSWFPKQTSTVSLWACIESGVVQDGRFFSSVFPWSRSGSQAEFKYTDLNSVGKLPVQNYPIFFSTPSYLRESLSSCRYIPRWSCSRGDGPSVKPIIHGLSYLCAPLGKQGKSSGGQRDKCPFFTPSALLCSV